MATVSPLYASASTITVALASLTSGSSVQTALISNNSTLYDDVFLDVFLTTSTGTLTNGRVIVWGFGTTGTNNTDGASSSAGSFTTANIVNSVFIGFISTPTASTGYKWGPVSIANAWGGKLPSSWGLIFQNDSGFGFNSTAGNFLVEMQGLNYTVQ